MKTKIYFTMPTFIGILICQLVLIVLKLTNVIQWDWVFVIAPLWIPYILFIVFGLILAIYVTVINIKEKISSKRN